MQMSRGKVAESNEAAVGGRQPGEQVLHGQTDLAGTIGSGNGHENGFHGFEREGLSPFGRGFEREGLSPFVVWIAFHHLFSVTMTRTTNPFSRIFGTDRTIARLFATLVSLLPLHTTF